MRSRWFLAPCGATLFLLLFFSTALPSYAAGRPTLTATIPTTDAASIVVDVLQNMQTNGFDAQANDDQGGLWLNWRYGTDPLETNVDAAGTANGSQVPPQQDRLADLRYMQNLWLYKRQHPDDTQFDSELLAVNHCSTSHCLMGESYFRRRGCLMNNLTLLGCVRPIAS